MKEKLKSVCEVAILRDRMAIKILNEGEKPMDRYSGTFKGLSLSEKQEILMNNLQPVMELFSTDVDKVRLGDAYAFRDLRAKIEAKQVKLECADCGQTFARAFPIPEDKELRCPNPECKSNNIDFKNVITDEEDVDEHRGN